MDTAALIFPAIKGNNWNNLFRVSATLKEEVDPSVLQTAVINLMPRFPSFYVKLRKGLFWNYLQNIDSPPAVREDYAYPLVFMGSAEMRTCCLRVLYYKNRIAAEFFHSVSDGTGGSIYLRTLVGEYLRLRHGITIEYDDSVLDPGDKPKVYELEDSFSKNAGKIAGRELGRKAYRLSGIREKGDFKHLITAVTDSGILHAKAREHGGTVTAFLAGVMLQTIIEIQSEEVPEGKEKPVRITIPVNMRRLFGSRTLRNFVLTLNLGVDPRTGPYTLDELIGNITNQLALKATKQNMAAEIASNVGLQKNLFIRAVPIDIKHIFMKMGYSSYGEQLGCINISNLGVVECPDPLKDYIDRIEFIIGPQQTYPNNCSVSTFNGKTFINMIRNTGGSDLERRFLTKLVELGIPLSVESNDIGGSESQCTASSAE